MTDKELIKALRRTQSRSKKALLDEAAERILDYAAEYSCPSSDIYQAKCAKIPEMSVSKCRLCWEKYIAEEEHNGTT